MRVSGVSESILIVEDEALIRMLVVDHLNELGYVTIEAGDSTAALPVLEGNGPIGLMLTDVGLPGMDGRALAEAARRIRPDLRILFATGDAPSIRDWPGFSEGAMGLVAKPFDMNELAEMVGRMLRDERI